jgi:hypothetical protein
MLKHGLEEWSFAWDNSKKRFGVCKYRRLNSGYPQVLLVYQGYW